MLLVGSLLLASFALTPSAQAEADLSLGLFHDPCDEPGAINVVNCAVDNGEILVCDAVYGYDNCLPIVALDFSSTAALALVGPCQDPGLMAVLKCAEDNGEILVCNAVYGRDNCLPIIYFDTASGDAALRLLDVTAIALPGPCQQPGLVAVVNCAAQNGEDLVCYAVWGYPNCINITWIRLPETALAGEFGAIALPGPCQDPGLLAVVYCARDNGENLVCYAVWGYPNCIKMILARLISTETTSAADFNFDTSGVIKDIFDAAACYQPGTVAVVECAGHNSEVLVCNAVYGRDDCTPLAF